MCAPGVSKGDMIDIDKIFKLLPHRLQHVDACVVRT